ncbi:hypothetical protein SUGI_1160760 [Cryptomeria japonica]|nr:hypothetical protein SUGI_1160760 [Cryptomeria japonica]
MELEKCLTSLWVLDVFILWALLSFSVVVSSKSQQVPALFIFGDSLSDDGNNNYLSSLARSNFPPYGIDFPFGPTGRFCNGRTVVDYIGQFLGLPFVPAYLAPSTKGKKVMEGVNYASAAAGILDDTGRNYGGRISFNGQISSFQNTLQVVSRRLGSPEAVSQFLSKSIFALSLGSNDYINNYLLPQFFTTSRQYSPQTFADLLISEYSKQLQGLYKLGARKFLVSTVGPLGCIPQQLAMTNSNGHCVESINKLIEPFNDGLLSLINQLNNNLTGSHFVYQNTYTAVLDMINNPTEYGFRVVNQGCCGVGRYNAQITCILFIQPCANRNQYVFWDAFHPTEAVNLILANKAFNGSPLDVYPINLTTLMQLHL